MKSKCVLLVDGNKNFMESAIKFLTTDKHFAIVGWAFSAAEAFDKIKKFNPDLILLDLKLPDMNGFEATKIIKKECQTAKVVILSLNDQNFYSAEAVNAGADGYICKSDFGTEIIPLFESLFIQNKISEPQ